MVYERRGGRKAVLAANAEAQARGVNPGQPLSAATARVPELEALERNPRAEREALKILAGIAYGFSGTVSCEAAAPAPSMHALWLEIGSSLRLFGGVEPLVSRLRETLAPLGYSVEIGVAPTLEGAFVLAGEAGRVADPDALLRALDALPVAELPLPEEAVAALEGSGIRTLGKLLSLPRDPLGRRFDMEFTDYLGRLTGRLPDARRWYRPPERYRRRFELAGEAEGMEALRFPLHRLLTELCAWLVAGDTGVAAFRLEFAHADGEPTRVDIGLASASRDAAHLQMLVHTRLERVVLRAPVREIALVAEQFSSPGVHQFDLFRARSGEEDEWTAVLDRLIARLGAEAVKSLGLRADHRPEKAWVAVPATAVPERNGRRAGVGVKEPEPKERPLWLLPEPRRLAGAPKCVNGPERIESGWWDGLDVRRDYYVAETGAGARLWVFRDRPSGQWYMHGLWS